MHKRISRGLAALALTACLATAGAPTARAAAHTFAIGTNTFLLDGQPLQIRCGEIHAPRVPREYWRDRLHTARAMGLNTVCAYLFWNLHEPIEGQFNWSGQADAAEFCRLAAGEGLWVILRPGPYSCAEWEMGGFPWWLLKKPDIRLRTSDPRYLAAAGRYLREVGRVLGPLQITHGGPILMVQVENEYGFYGKDSGYMGTLRQAMVDAGFDVPLFDCDPPSHLRDGHRPDLFPVVNFGADPAGGFRALREVLPAGPLMCGEFYPGWFDTWGSPHHLGNTPRYLADLEYMLRVGGSFSIYMAHGGTTFGWWSGADRPFKPDTSSYDYDAPISEAGWVGEKFQKTRELFARHLAPGETLPEPSPRNPVIAFPSVTASGWSPLLANLPAGVRDERPRNMEQYDEGYGCILYRTTVPAGPAATLEAAGVRDFGYVFLAGERLGVMDRRSGKFKVALPARREAGTLDILVETMGRVNFGPEVHDRKGLQAPVRLGSGPELTGWQVFPLPYREGAGVFDRLPFTAPPAGGTGHTPGFWRLTAKLDRPGDTFLDVGTWGKGLAWVNGHCLGRFWNIGPSQTMYVPGPWLRAGDNEIVILDFAGPGKAAVAGLATPVLDALHPELDFAQVRRPEVTLHLEGIRPAHAAAFAPGTAMQEVHFAAAARGRYFCLESLSAQDGKPYAAVAELDLLDEAGKPLSHEGWTIGYVDSEEREREDGTAENAIDGQVANLWHTQWGAASPAHPHRLILDLGQTRTVGGFRYVPRQGDGNVGGRIKEYRILVGDHLITIPGSAAASTAPISEIATVTPAAGGGEGQGGAGEILAAADTDPEGDPSLAGEASAVRPGPRGADRGVYRDRLDPHWFGDNTKFWYRVETGKDRREFVLVDAVKGLRAPAFDHDRLAKALTGAGVTNSGPGRLPFDVIEWEDGAGAVRFQAGGKGWRGDLASYTLTAAAATNHAPVGGLPLDGGPRASRRTGEETTLVFINRTAGRVRLFWLDSEGQRQPYGELDAGQSREQHTFAGHVWLATDTVGKSVALFEASDTGGDAVITGTPPAAGAPPERPRRRNRSTGAESPDGHWRASVQQRNVVLKRVDSGAEHPLTTDGSEDDSYGGGFYWSPDSRKLVVLRTRKGDDRKVYLVESSPKDQLQPKLSSYEYLKPGDRVPVAKPHLFDVESGKETPVDDALFPNPWSLDDVRWSPDSSRFTFLYNQRGHQVLRVIGVDAATGRTAAIIDERSDTFIDYSGKFYCEYLEGTSEILWMSERDGWNHLYLYDTKAGGPARPVTHGEWVVRGVDRVDPEKRQVWFRAGGIHPGQDPYQIHFCRVNFDGSGLTTLTAGDGTHQVRYSPDGRFLVDSYSRVDLPPVTELRRTADGSLVCALENGDASELIASGWRPPERFTAKGRDDTTGIYGIITRPSDFDPHGKYPVIESIYAGPQDSFVPKSFQTSSSPRKLADLGFIIVQIDGMGTANRSKKFHDVCWRNLADAGFPDRVRWIRAAAATRPEMDLARVGIYGTSAGGQSALAGLLTHGDFYHAGVADCGCHDNRMDKIWWNEQWMGWPIGPHFEAQSNVTMAGRLTGKLLLVVGEMDRNVDPSSTMQVVNALIKADKDFELLVMPGAGHGVLGTPYGQRRLGEFFTRHLLRKG